MYDQTLYKKIKQIADIKRDTLYGVQVVTEVN